MGRAADEERWLIALPEGRRVNVKMSNIKPAGDLDAEVVQREATSAVPLKEPEDPPNRSMLEAHNLTHLPAAPWCEICIQARGKSDWHTQVKCEIPCVQMDFQSICGVAVWRPEAHAKATELTMVDIGHWVCWSFDGFRKEPRQMHGEVDILICGFVEGSENETEMRQ